MAAPGRKVHTVITGRVQGVWFRGWTVDQARALGLDGWVRNRGDGSVEAVLAGPETAVQNMLVALHQGPPAARVHTVAVSDWDGNVAPGFQQYPTEL